jgi:hypothetical protein
MKAMDADLAADKLAEALFTLFVIGDERTLLAELRQRCESSPSFRPDVFESQVFAYLAASIALALTNEYARQPKSADVISSLRRLVRDEAARRGQSMDDLDDSIEEAAEKLGTLIDADPNSGYSFDWAREWLNRCGVEECNPAVLFDLSHKWKVQSITLLKSVSETRIA